MLLVLVLSGHSARNILDAQTTDPHAYFNALVTRPEHYRSYSLRDPKQLATRNNGGYAQCNNCPLDVTYNPTNDPDPRRQDAAKLVVPASNNDIGNPVYLPLGTQDGHTYLVTWDAWWGAEFDYGNTNLGTYKAFQFAQPGGTGSPCMGNPGWFEVQERFNQASGSAIAKTTARSYFPAQDPIPGADFTVQPERWVRYWVLIEKNAEPTPSYFSMWMADTQAGPVQLLNRAALKSCASVSNFWIEFNTSSAWSTRVVGPLVAYLRNVVMLKDVVGPTTLFQRPNSGAPLPPPPTPTAPSAPKNLRIVSP
jgi:hypothetical protein